jgi:hypothetical protein
VPARCGIYRGQKQTSSDRIWRYEGQQRSPYEYEWEDLIDAIRQDLPYNEVKRGAEASLVTSMGRMAAHTGRRINYAEFAKFDHEFAPHVDALTAGAEPPLQPDEHGRYAVPQPGLITTREY